MGLRLSRRRFEQLVLEALESIPLPLRQRMENVAVVVEAWPTPEQLASVGLGPDDLLFGLYEGTPLVERGVLAEPLLPDRITIFQGPLEEACDTEEEIREEVRTTIIHEVAHHFGFDEERLAELGYE
ncbi:MAG: metallopeptidase family protein [Armatimonadota bacterium]|nr:metallopeptidase family protein [Armatimonadota bacterium]MDR7448635.1 metallopeptidase family protein [Armatimonadota bacterium]MDR7459381.1 metallopeptidase family protein [Armatimonadota bacterium]MDR7478570.1 metallopeptidase family protein [Armatimonadota bacterium]MDR7488104.1 metallopeptidase family protein [Armatimonadota bacterium]